jgi:very-short-patch-repair endonuclease
MACVSKSSGEPGEGVLVSGPARTLAKAITPNKLQPMKRDLARSLRRQMTDAEAKPWRALRNRTFAGCKFRRQVPIGPYVVDFISHERRLVIELDGGQHGDQLAYDAARTRRIERDGYRVLRFWNNDVLRNIEGVLQVIASALDTPHPPTA